jgi:hypothetical protein
MFLRGPQNFQIMMSAHTTLWQVKFRMQRVESPLIAAMNLILLHIIHAILEHDNADDKENKRNDENAAYGKPTERSPISPNAVKPNKKSGYTAEASK